MEAAIHTDSQNRPGKTGSVSRNRNIDIVRSIALLWVIIYHIWILTGGARITNPVLDDFVRFGGEIGVTIFFVLSGYGIFLSLSHQDLTGQLHFLPFMKKRLIRILPEYDLSLFVLVFFTSQAACLSTAGLKLAILHFVFLHNVDAVTAGSINGALWTMAVIVQFYLFAIPMYRLLQKTKFFYPVLFMAITIGCKIICFHYLKLANDFWASRQILPSVIDNFALGMFTAWLAQRKPLEATNKKWFNLVMITLSFVLLYLVCQFGVNHGIHSDTASGYVWHTLIALCVCFGIFFYARKELSGSHIIKRGLLWISKYEYGIYIVHLVLIVNLLEYSTILQKISAYPAAKYPVFTFLSMFFGWILCKCADGIRTCLIIDKTR